VSSSVSCRIRTSTPRTVILLTLFCCALASACPRILHAEPRAASKTAVADDRENSCRIIYLGFVGALEPPANKHSGVVQIRDTLRGKDFPDVCARSYSPYTWLDGRDWLLTHFPTHAGALTSAELRVAPKVILVGHSMGGWSAMSVARELRSREIPVELTIQVDSVGITDYTIPRNVKNGAIFHAHDALTLLTTKHLRCEDPLHTILLANITVAGAGHQSITRDPRIRALVMQAIDDLRADFALELFLAGTPNSMRVPKPAN
jgi:pimeloyl-ACP methyl ester carboxylesterase